MREAVQVWDDVAGDPVDMLCGDVVGHLDDDQMPAALSGADAFDVRAEPRDFLALRDVRDGETSRRIAGPSSVLW